MREGEVTSSREIGARPSSTGLLHILRFGMTLEGCAFSARAETLYISIVVGRCKSAYIDASCYPFFLIFAYTYDQFINICCRNTFHPLHRTPSSRFANQPNHSFFSISLTNSLASLPDPKPSSRASTSSLETSSSGTATGFSSN